MRVARLPIVSAWATVVAITLSFPSSVSSDVCAQPYGQISSASSANTITLHATTVGEGAEICGTCLTFASDSWNNGCSGDQTPRFQQSAGGDLTVNVDFYAGTNPGTITNCTSDKCGCTQTMVNSDGRIIGATVSLFPSASGTANCQGSWDHVLTHELGHVLGLQDAPACSNRIMGNNFAGIQDNDCEAADGNFLSGTERVLADRDHPCSNPPA